jgi:serine/threonine protein kinase/Tol biopolymer transport system component
MALAVGGRCGPYEVTAKIGAGGMGEVYRARDTRLDRDVALKILPEAFASDPERLARFEREAKTLAALNHPHIAHIHGLEESGAVRALVLELVDGPTLADRIAQGAIPIEEALAIARQIADALEAAHEQGIIHRDLKPANIKLRTDGTVKVLDFGLAKALDPKSAGPVDPAASPTLTSPALMTGVGVILGTAAYMSPEQARGQAINKGTDIWAFGCVLFEMLSGRMAFRGATMSDTIAAVLERSPDWAVLPSATPPPVQHVLARCLEKDPKLRWRDIGDVRIELDAAARGWRAGTDSESPKISRAGERAAWSLLVALTAAAVAIATPVLRKTPAPAEIRFNVFFPRGVTPDFAQLAISPDGQQIVVSPSFGVQGPSPLWLRSLASTSGRLLTGTEGGGFPFWSPDGQSIGFFAEQKLKRLDVNSQAIQTLADAPVARGGAWQSDGTILFAPNATGPLVRVPATGGQATVATQLSAGQNDHRAPFILPDATHFLYYARGTPEARGVYVSRLDGTESKRLLDADGAAVYAPSGNLLFARQGELMAQSFDVRRLALEGEPFRVADSVAVNPGVSLASLSASASGPIAYATDSIRRTQFAWFDRSGRRLETVGTPDQRSMANPSLSPDGSRVAFSRVVGGNWDIWLLDMQGAASKITSALALDFSPVWSPDGRQLFYQSNNSSIQSRSVSEGTPEQEVLKERTMMYPTDVSPDGTVLLYTRASGPSTDLWYVSLGSDRTPHPFTQTVASERDGQFAPDGKWVAYQANDAGHNEVYLQPFPGPGDRIQVSSGGGQQVRWARNGSELFYIAADQRLTSVRVTIGAGGKIGFGPPLPLFRTEFDTSFLSRQQYVVSPDGQRFLINAATDAIDPPSITFILNWKGRP